MGYIRQNENVICWGTIGKVQEPQVIETKNGNMQVLKFGVCTGTTAEGTKIWTNVECWGAQALREDVKQWQTAFVAGKFVENKYINKQNAEVTRVYVRAEFISINTTNDDFLKMKKQQEEDAENEGNNDSLPF